MILFFSEKAFTAWKIKCKKTNVVVRLLLFTNRKFSTKLKWLFFTCKLFRALWQSSICTFGCFRAWLTTVVKNDVSQNDGTTSWLISPRKKAFRCVSGPTPVNAVLLSCDSFECSTFAADKPNFKLIAKMSFRIIIVCNEKISRFA